MIQIDLNTIINIYIYICSSYKKNIKKKTPQQIKILCTKNLHKTYMGTTAYPWCDGHSTSISACRVWGVRARVQV